jgi:1-acyl-sn-glycerol-3-phosphate acyltransferase
VFTFVGLKEMFPFNNGQGHPGKVRIFMNDIIEPTKNIQELKEVSHNLIKFTLENN